MESGPHCLVSHVPTHALPISEMEQHQEDQQLGPHPQLWGNKESMHSGLLCPLRIYVFLVPCIYKGGPALRNSPEAAGFLPQATEEEETRSQGINL